MKYLFKISICLLTLAWLGVTAVDADSKVELTPGDVELRLAGKRLDSADFCIVIPDEPTWTESFAAEELRSYLAGMTGEYLEILQEGEDIGKKIPICLGRYPLHKRFWITPRPDLLGESGVNIAVHPKFVMLAGYERGVLFAVYEFLEKYCNIRFLAPDSVIMPETGTIDIAALDYLYKPPFEMRDCNYAPTLDPRFGLRMKLNGFMLPHSRQYGKYYGYAGHNGFSHTFERMVPVKQYYQEHPEYYSQNTAEKDPHKLQLCLSNPEVKKIVIAAAREWLKQTPDRRFISISQNDRHNYCRCDACNLVLKEEGAPVGIQLRFINDIAAALKADFPDVMVDTLIYGYTYSAPKKTKAADNVVLRLAPIQACFNHALDGCDYNRSNVEPIFADWSKHANNRYAWYYTMNYDGNFLIFPNLYALQPQIRYLKKQKIKGVFYEGREENGVEMAELRSYLICRLLWNPDENVDALIEEFVNGYYGKAAPFIKQYIELIHSASAEKDLTISTGPDVSLNQQTVLQGDQLMQQAEQAAAGNSVHLKRVKNARIPTLTARLRFNRTMRNVVGDKLVPVEENGAALIDQIAQYAKELNIIYALRWKSLQVYLDAMRAELPQATPVLALTNPALKILITPEEQGRIWSITDSQAREQLRIISPDSGGIETAVQLEEEKSPLKLSAKIISRTDNTLELSSSSDHPLRISRSYELDKTQPILKVTLKVENLSSKEQSVHLSISPYLAVSNLRSGSLRRFNSDGSKRLHQLYDFGDPRWGKSSMLDKTEKSTGKWALYDSDGPKNITVTFLPEQFDQCHAQGGGIDRYLLLQGKKNAKIPPGQSVEITQQYRFDNNAD